MSSPLNQHVFNVYFYVAESLLLVQPCGRRDKKKKRTTTGKPTVLWGISANVNQLLGFLPRI